ncbi:MAG: hypothetical protein WKG07_04030 [Hymenobacter sp.]
MLRKLLPLLGAALLTQAALAQTAPPLDSLRRRAERAIRAKRYPEAADLLRQQAQAEPYPSAQAGPLTTRPARWALAGQPEAALQALAVAQRRGFNKASLAREDADLTSAAHLPRIQQNSGPHGEGGGPPVRPPPGPARDQRHRPCSGAPTTGRPRIRPTPKLFISVNTSTRAAWACRIIS